MTPKLGARKFRAGTSMADLLQHLGHPVGPDEAGGGQQRPPWLRPLQQAGTTLGSRSSWAADTRPAGGLSTSTCCCSTGAACEVSPQRCCCSCRSSAVPQVYEEGHGRPRCVETLGGAEPSRGCGRGGLMGGLQQVDTATGVDAYLFILRKQNLPNGNLPRN